MASQQKEGEMMLNLEESEISFIKDNLENADKMLLSKSVNDILLALDDLITAEGFDVNYDLNDFGRKAQKMYDNIYNNN
jgi:hypothetical protein